MKNDDNKAITERLCKYLRNMSYPELAELNINGQQIVKIKNGLPVRFHAKTLARLRKLVDRRAS